MVSQGVEDWDEKKALTGTLIEEELEAEIGDAEGAANPSLRSLRKRWWEDDLGRTRQLQRPRIPIADHAQKQTL
ncbi:hypothetical protein TNCV_3357721 [Trichonephila clavipes]|nr:hypothetical protein TNCV_3357721 [Trichonephila clavipes]